MAPPAGARRVLWNEGDALKVEDAREAGATLASAAAFVGSHDGS
jgi:hypothetical protein